MTSDQAVAFVWTWLGGALEPVVAGRLDHVGSTLVFTYGRSYLERADAVPVYEPELPLQQGPITPEAGDVAGCITDAAPDAWGRRVILNQVVGREDDDTEQLDLVTYLLESGSNRIGALDFQASALGYVARSAGQATLAELLTSAEKVEQGIALSPALDQALLHGSSIGGARPKAVLIAEDRQLIAKFSSTTDTRPVVKGEFVAMRLAASVGLDVAPVELVQVEGKDVLLVERFDRTADGGRRAMVSALTILGLDEFLSARYASYADLADVIRGRFVAPGEALRELFSRIIFNILTGNTDDHARNHAAFWNGHELALTPAYDICPQGRAGGEAAQVMAIGKDGWKYSQVEGCIERAGTYLLSADEARAIVDHQIRTIASEWESVCDAGGLTDVDRRLMYGRQFLNPYALEGYDVADGVPIPR